MKTTIRQTVAAALLMGACGAASAFDLSTYTGPVLYASGSTSIDQALQAYFIQTVGDAALASLSPCDPTQPIDIYIGGANGAKFLAIACIARGAVGLNPGSTQQIAFIKEQNGGSANGISPVGTGGANVVYPVLSTLTAANCSASGSGGVSPPEQASYNLHKCASGYSTTMLHPNFGFADVEASIFGINSSSIGLTAIPTIDVVYAPAVSLGLYHALQASQGLTQDDVNTHIPSLSKAELTSLFTGGIAAWSYMFNAAGTTAVSAQSVSCGSTGHTVFGPGAPSSASVFLCRRNANSGAEKVTEIHFGGLNCTNTGSVAAFRTGLGGAAGTGWMQDATHTNAVTFNGSGTGEVLKCLQGHDTVGHFAIGFASVDNPWGANQTTLNNNTDRNDWRFIKVDGVVPSIENAASGKYHYWAQSTAYIPSTSAPNYPDGDALQLMDYMLSSVATGIGYAYSVGAFDEGLEWGTGTLAGPQWDGGVLAIPNGGANHLPNAPSASLATFHALPVSSYVKATAITSGATANNCQTPQLLAGASTGTDGTVNWSNP